MYVTKTIFLLTPSAAVQCWLQLQRLLVPSPKSDTADVHLQKVIDWLCISTSHNPTSKILSYLFKRCSKLFKTQSLYETESFSVCSVSSSVCQLSAAGKASTMEKTKGSVKTGLLDRRTGLRFAHSKIITSKRFLLQLVWHFFCSWLSLGLKFRLIRKKEKKFLKLEWQNRVWGTILTKSYFMVNGLYL